MPSLNVVISYTLTNEIIRYRFSKSTTVLLPNQEANHTLKPWWEYLLGILINAYKEFEQRVGAINKTRGAKTAIITEAIASAPVTFSISDIQRLCP